MLFRRMLPRLFFVATWLSVAAASAGDDPIAAQLKKETQAFRAAQTEYARDVEGWLDRRTKAVQTSGDVHAIRALEEARAAFESARTLPTGAPAGYRRKLWTAEDRMSVNLAAAARKYRKKGDHAEAEKVESTLLEFQEQTDRIPYGSHWQGTWSTCLRKSKATPAGGVGKVEIVSRNATSFRMRASLSDQRVWLYDVERGNDRVYRVTRAHLAVVQNSFGDSIGDYVIVGSEVKVDGDRLEFKVARKAGDDILDAVWVLNRAD